MNNKFTVNSMKAIEISIIFNCINDESNTPTYTEYGVTFFHSAEDLHGINIYTDPHSLVRKTMVYSSFTSKQPTVATAENYLLRFLNKELS
jgi:hypothetical protein